MTTMKLFLTRNYFVFERMSAKGNMLFMTEANTQTKKLIYNSMSNTAFHTN